MTKIYCRWDGKFLYDDTSSSDRFHFCKYSKPNCTIEYRNLIRSITTAEESENKFIKQVSRLVRKRIEKGTLPVTQKRLIQLVIKERRPELLLMVKQS